METANQKLKSKSYFLHLLLRCNSDELAVNDLHKTETFNKRIIPRCFSIR